MNLTERLRSYWQLLNRDFSGNTHAERLESFYSKQADGYDKSRVDICPRRDQFYQNAAQLPGNTWLDIGGGTGAALDLMPEERLRSLDKLVIVDLTPSLLEKAREKVATRRLNNVELINADACQLTLANQFDVVSFCYSLTMIPNWWLALETAKRCLTNEGHLAITDFYVSQKSAAHGRQQHGWFTREVLTSIFATDHVFLNKDHLPYLCDMFEKQSLLEATHGLPGFSAIKRPYYQFIGKNKHQQQYLVSLMPPLFGC